jgi:hypothetical protein
MQRTGEGVRTPEDTRPLGPTPMIRVDVARPDSLRQPDDGPVGMSVDDDGCGGKPVNSNRLRRPATAQQQRNLAPAARPHRGENPNPERDPRGRRQAAPPAPTWVIATAANTLLGDDRGPAGHTPQLAVPTST